MDRSALQKLPSKATPWNVYQTPRVRGELGPAREQIVRREKEKQTAVVGRANTSQLEKQILHLGEESKAKDEGNRAQTKGSNFINSADFNVHTAVEPLIVPEGAKIGECVTFVGHEGKQGDVLNVAYERVSRRGGRTAFI